VDGLLAMIKNLKDIDHPLIPKTYYSFQSDSSLYLITDYVDRGELFEHLMKKNMFYYDIAKFYFMEMASVVMYLHSKNIILQKTGLEDFVLDKSGHCYLVDLDHAIKYSQNTKVHSNIRYSNSFRQFTFQKQFIIHPNQLPVVI